jgi:4-hydroxythreonine-4-phosphate dehydrogenase
MNRNSKIIYVGSYNSINLEIIFKSIHFLFKKKIKFCLVGDFNKILKYQKLHKLNFTLIQSEEFSFKKNKICIVDTKNILKKFKTKILNEIYFSFYLAKKNDADLVTMPINKYEIKNKENFNGITEFLGIINKNKSFMLMKGDVFSIIPLTTHIPLKHVPKEFKSNLKNLDVLFSKFINSKLFFKNIIFLGFNPHAGENGTLGDEDILLRNIIIKLKRKFPSYKILGPLSADSAFKKIPKNSIYISAYHDQALIPFKLLNNNQINMTLGLKIKRYSPAHGTAIDIKNKKIADNSSFIQCMLI